MRCQKDSYQNMQHKIVIFKQILGEMKQTGEGHAKELFTEPLRKLTEHNRKNTSGIVDLLTGHYRLNKNMYYYCY